MDWLKDDILFKFYEENGKFNIYLNQNFFETWYTKKEPLTGWAAFLCKIYETYLVSFDSYMLVKI